MIEIIDKKEKLKKTLENYNLKIEQDKQMLKELNEDENNENDDEVQNDLNVKNNENYENEINYNDINSNENNNIKSNNNQYIDGVEEEYENELSTKKI